MDNKGFEDSEYTERSNKNEKGATATSAPSSPTQTREKKLKNVFALTRSRQRSAQQLPVSTMPTLHESSSSSELAEQADPSQLPLREFANGQQRRRSLMDSSPETGINMSDFSDSSANNRGVTNRPKASMKKKNSISSFLVRQMTRDVVPHINNYRAQYETSIRPTLSELYNRTNSERLTEEHGDEGAHKAETKIKFGWIEGVLIRNMMSIWGVMLFLRLSWVVAQAGLGETLVIIAISTFITLVTALSTSAISTNGEIGGGGTYFVTSRVLGPEFGGSIGIIFAIANAMDCALNVVGFAQVIVDMMKAYGGFIIVDGGYNDVRIIGTLTTMLVCAVCGMGSYYETKMKDAMLVVMMASLANFFAGSIMGPADELEQAKGFVGYNLTVLQQNWYSSYIVTDGKLQNFISVFSVYFPACIGILAGANVTGDLKDPNKAIPKGTIWAIIICSFFYAAVAIVCAATMVRAATGNVTDLHNGTYLDCKTHVCKSGLYYDYQAMSLISAFAPLNYAGCMSATISTALSDFVSSPALIEVIAADKLYPYWLVGFMGKSYGKFKQPLRAFGVTFVLSLAFVLIAQLDTIAILISDFFLATFALLNFSTFHISLIKPIGWRPTFKHYNTWLSLLTGILSIAAIILIDIYIAMITIAIVIFFYLIVLYRKPAVNWGSSTQAQTYNAALNGIQQLVHVEEHVKNYRPQILVLTGLPNTRPALVDFAYLICKKNSLMLCGHVEQTFLTTELRNSMNRKAYRYFRVTGIKGFFAVAGNASLHEGARSMLSLAGVGKVKPNILMMGYKNDWLTCDRSSLNEYVLTIHTAFEMNVGAAILRLQDGLDCSNILGDIGEQMSTSTRFKKNRQESCDSSASSTGFSPTPASSFDFSASFNNRDDSIDITNETDGHNEETKHSVISKSKKSKKKQKQATVYRDPEGNELPKSVLNKIIIFQKKQKKDTIDVWWLSDDGGLTLLLPVIINNRSNWSETKLRIFCTVSNVSELEKEQKGMAILLSKFRIDYSDLVTVNTVKHAPKNRTKKWFDDLIKPFLQPRTDGLQITKSELETYQYKTDRHLRLRDLLLDHSSDSNLVVMTLPMPRKGAISAPLYMAWLETLTANMPPFMLVRGNQTSVLTFYV